MQSAGSAMPIIIKKSPFFIGAVALLATVGAGFAADIPVAPIVVPPPPPPPVVCENHIYAGADYLRMTRQDPDATPLVTSLGPAGDLLDATDFSFGWSSGVSGRAGIIFCNIGFEVGGFWISPMSAFRDDLDPDEPDILIETTPATDIFGVSHCQWLQ
jgi:hypothetical protein